MIYIEKNSKKATPRNLDKQIFFITLTTTMQEHTPGFYDLELDRAKRSYTIARQRLVFEQQRQGLYSIENEENYMRTINDYILATCDAHTIKSGHIKYLYENAYTKTQERRTIFQKIKQLFR